MILPSVRASITRDLRAFRRTIEAYPDDQAPWREVPGLPNSAGTLALHVAGNIRHFVGARLGGSAYVRNRDAEFRTRGLPRAELLRELDEALDAVLLTFGTLDNASVQLPFEEKVAGRQFRTGELLVHLAVHLAFHLGQADYHRRITTAQPKTIDPVSAAELYDLLNQ